MIITMSNKPVPHHLTITSDTRAILVLYFKPSGKYYTEETYLVDDSLSVEEIAIAIATYPAFKGMSATILFDSTDTLGYPISVPYSDRM